MALRTSILKHALPLVPQHSFTRHTLLLALPSLDPAHPDYQPDVSESVIDTLFGNGNTAPARALVDAWVGEGLHAVQGANTRERLKNRLRYSSLVGEHLVEAYAVLASPGSTPSLPIPRIPLSILQSLNLPRLYSPPPSSPLSPLSSSSNSPASSPSSTAETLHSLLDATSNRIPFVGVNPAGPLAYAWRIADRALKADEQTQQIQNGLMGEPAGSGPEWYTARISLMGAYLAAEARLLQPYPASPLADNATNPFLVEAERKLDEHMDRYDAAAKAVSEGSEHTGYLMDYLGHLGRSALGIIRSRGF
ncbi:hypothetical protein DB88DRAFT_544500 [Papiliotrema laurentii]|uniref:Ubiquinone biosynthesis protein n=1 Tax=Papiliotrema laurentii TaxID=5418 RepID=A0AAD9FU59_PAPLA|nr:hypothetical protein DB88DRAFT_544500 [Papiliotrema laurentii]